MCASIQTSFPNPEPTSIANGIPSSSQLTLTRNTDLPSKFNAANQSSSDVVEMANLLEHADARVVEYFPPTRTQTQWSTWTWDDLSSSRSALAALTRPSHASYRNSCRSQLFLQPGCRKPATRTPAVRTLPNRAWKIVAVKVDRLSLNPYRSAVSFAFGIWSLKVAEFPYKENQTSLYGLKNIPFGVSKLVQWMRIASCVETSDGQLGGLVIWTGVRVVYESAATKTQRNKRPKPRSSVREQIPKVAMSGEEAGAEVWWSLLPDAHVTLDGTDKVTQDLARMYFSAGLRPDAKWRTRH
ncbi:unnamed protein product, partial [Dibothriocephalus latus]